MIYSTKTQRQALIEGLHALADFLEVNQDVPAPPYAYIMVFPPTASDEEKRREIDAIATIIGSETETETAYHHYVTSRRFGPVEYRAIAIPEDYRSEGK